MRTGATRSMMKLEIVAVVFGSRPVVEKNYIQISIAQSDFHSPTSQNYIANIIV